MSALLQELADHGVTSEDIEKAAAARLFEKTAAAEGIDLSSMNEEQQDGLFDHFVENVLPGMVGGEKEASAEDEFVEAVMAKVASLDDDTKIALFEKQAAYEGMDLSGLGEEDLQGAYGYFCENLLPTMVAQDGYPVKVADADFDKVAEAEKVAEAQAKLAEAEILGRHMARAFHDESGKIAAHYVHPDGTPAPIQHPPAVHEKGIGKVRQKLESASNTARQAGEKGLRYAKANPGKAVGAGLLTAGALTAAGVGGKKLYDRRQAAQQGDSEQKAANAPILEALAMQKAAEILEANGIDPTTGEAKQASIDEVVDYRAMEILEASGYTFQ